ncbi:MAG: Asp-tRNA(Asn)/Glu-tRNA(Gln) amidotransferase subunit GatC [Xanthomonadaceae bacterium]|nr:Asp-tRNA(Asn)/Glu-tRNA(Gln) amidotransferase subunit GatC [Rhodospirillaceae bacterium]NIA18119.1 Asp-tRNA(Asn)/Glu-tRNA(Gln) amidotransferase subunit GatC [Xanthomonadaceae bacterium]
MKLNKQQVEHIAVLARLKLTEKEKEMFAVQLSSILDYVEKLKEIDTKGLEETSQVTGLINSVREDIIEDSTLESKKEILENAPDKEGDLFKVKNVFK